MLSSPGRPSSAPTPSSRLDYTETAPSRSRSPARDPGQTLGAQTSGTPPHTRSGNERRPRLGRPEGKGRHPRAYTPESRIPHRAAQAGLAAWPTDPQGHRQSFTWWAGASMTPGAGPPPHGPREHRTQAILPITDGRGWPERTLRGALDSQSGPSSAPPSSMTLTICLTCGQPILQPAGHPPTPGTQPLPVGSPRQALAERIGWRYFQTALSQMQTDPRRTLELVRSRWLHPHELSGAG